jgi:hypothetical protein
VVLMAEKMTRAELAAFIEELQILLADGELFGLGTIVRRGKGWDIEQAASDMLRRVTYYRSMDPEQREALGPKTMRHELADELAMLREALEGAGILRAGGAGDRIAIRAKPPRLRPDRRR